MHYFPSKSSRISHLNHKISDKRAKFSDKWSPGVALRPPAPICLALVLSLHMGIFAKKAIAIAKKAVNGTNKRSLGALYGDYDSSFEQSLASIGSITVP